MPARSRQKPGVTYDELSELALALPGVEAGTSYGTPALKVKGKLLVRLWEDGETVVLRLPFDEREILLAADPDVFFLTDHYAGYPTVLVRLAKVRRDQLADLLELSWRSQAPGKLVAAFDAGKAPGRWRDPVPSSALRSRFKV